MKAKREIISKNEWIAIFSIIVIMLLFAVAQPLFTGFVVKEKENAYSEKISEDFTSSSEYEWQMENLGLLKSFRISGAMDNNTIGKIYLETDGTRYLIFDTTKQESVNGITGFVVDENGNEIINEETPTTNETINETISNETIINETLNNNPINETALDETINEENSITNETQSNETIINETTPITNETLQNNETTLINDSIKSINIKLKYNEDSFYDEDNDGKELITNVIDFSVKDTEFNWDADKSNACTKWEVYSAESETVTRSCSGNEECCALIGLIPQSDLWDDNLYLAYNSLGATYSNIVSAQVIYSDTNEIVYSSWGNLSAEFREEGLTEFDNECDETCILPEINQSNYKIIVELESGRIILNNLTYTVLQQENSQPPILIADLQNYTIKQNELLQINLSNYFQDPDNDPLEYGYYKSAEDVSVAISDGIANITPGNDFLGNAYMFITANDSESSISSNIFEVVVEKASFRENITQLDAEIGKPVKWVKRVSFDIEKENASIIIPKEAFNITIEKIDNGKKSEINKTNARVSHNGRIKPLGEYDTEREIDVVSRKLSREKDKGKKDMLESRLGELKAAINATSAQNDPNMLNSSEVNITIEEKIKEAVVEYQTEAPEKEEEEISNSRKLVKIISDLHYENILAYTRITEVPQSAIKLYWLKNGEKELFENVTYIDADENGLIERIEWIVPHLSNQTFEVNLNVIDLQSYPIVGGTWLVRFNATGTANLTISASNGTTYAEKETDNLLTANDLDAMELRCGDNTLLNYKDSVIADNAYLIDGIGSKIKINDTIGQQIPIKSIFVGDYSCNDSLGFWTVKVLTGGKHTQRFDFGNFSAYANNYALQGLVFVDNTDDDFGQGLFYRANVTGSGNNANVTLNYSTNSNMRALKTYNISGNITSRIFNATQQHAVFDRIAWESFLPNSSDVMGITSHDAANRVAAFYRNGSFGVDLFSKNFGNVTNFSQALNRYTLPAGLSYDDIMCAAVDDDGTNVVYLLMMNGTTASVAAANFNADLTFTTVAGVNTIPVNFNFSDVVGCAIDAGVTDSALFFRNGSMVVNTGDENPPVAFGAVLAYSLPAGWDRSQLLDITVDNAANNIVAFYRNGSVANATSVSFAASKVITSATDIAVYNNRDDDTYVNVTESTNVTLQTRVSNDTVVWAPWSSIYVDYDGSQPIESNIGKYIQYKAVLTTRDKYITPYLENVSINYSLDFIQPSVNSSLNNTSPKIGEIINFTANISDNSQLSFCQFIDNQSNGAKRFFNVSISGQSDRCSQNFTINLARGNVINFSLIVNDSYNNRNQTDFVITVANSPPVCAAGTLNNTSPFTNDVINQTGCIYSDADSDPQATSQYMWFRNNAEIAGQTSGTLNLALAGNGDRGDTINASERPFDGLEFGSWINVSQFAIVQNSIPSASILLPPEDQYTNQQPISFNITFEADHDNDAINILYYVNGRLNQTSSVNTTFNASDGYYILNVSLSDGTNSSANSTVNFTIDTKDPSVSLIGPLNATYNTSGMLQMGYIGNDLNIDACTLFTNFSGIWKANQTNSSQISGAASFFNTTINNEGLFVWNVFCNDTAGNFGYNATNFTIIVDVNNPRLQFVNPTPSNNTNISSATQIFNATHSDNNPHTLIFSLNDSIANQTMSYGNTAFTNITKMNLRGTYGFYFLANDTAGRNNQTETRIVNIDPLGPESFAEGPRNNTWNNSLIQLFGYNVSDDWLGTKNCSLLMTLPAGYPYANVSNGSLTGTFASSGGSIENITKPNDNSIWFVGTTGASTVTASVNTTFNLSNVDRSIVKDLLFNIRYCHSGAANGACGTPPVGGASVEAHQNLTVYNFSSGHWVSLGTLNNTATKGTNGNIERKMFNINGDASDFMNTTSNQVKIGIRAHFTSIAPGDAIYLTLDFVNITADTRVVTNTSITENAHQNFSANINSGIYNWNVDCMDYAGSRNLSATQIIKIDKTFPTILNQSINMTEVLVNSKICFNVTINDTFSSIKYVYAEIDRPDSGHTNFSMTNDTTDPNSCGGFGGNVWSYARLVTEEGKANWTAVYAEDFAGNVNMSEKPNLNWTQRANIFINSTLVYPMLNLVVNESDLSMNYTFFMGCNVTCSEESQTPCSDVTIKPQYADHIDDIWHDLTNISPVLTSNVMNKSCGDIIQNDHCNASFAVRTSIDSGNKNFTLRCKAKGANTPNDYSPQIPNATVNDHPEAVFSYPEDQSYLRGNVLFNFSASSDDRNISVYLLEYDDNLQFLTPSTICSTNESNCTFNTITQQSLGQCEEDSFDCFFRVNITDNDNLVNSTIILAQIDNTAPSVRLNLPTNSTYTAFSEVIFNYTAFDTNLSACSVYTNETGVFSIEETNDTVKNATDDIFNITLLDRTIVWNVGCNDTAGNFNFNSSNLTLTVDTVNPGISFTDPTAFNNTYTAGDYILANVSVNERNFANITFYLYNSSFDLVNETNFTTSTFFMNFSRLANINEIYYYNVTTRDKASLENSTETRKITLDNLVPRVNFTEPTESNNTYLAQNYTFVNVTINETNFANATFYLYNSAFVLVNETNITSADAPTNLSFNFTSLPDGRYYYNVTARDRISFENSTETRGIILDNFAPVVRLNAPANNTIYPNATVFFNFTAFEPNARNCTLYANFSSVFDANVSNTSIVSGANTLLEVNVSEGTYIWNVRCYDFLDRDSFNSTNFTIRVDSLAPAEFNLSMPANGTESRNLTPELNWTEASDDNFFNYTILMDNNKDFASLDFVYKTTWLSSNSSFNVTNDLTVDTEWYWKVSAYDALQKSTNSSGYFVYITDQVSPRVNLLSPANFSLQNSSVINFMFNVSELNTVSNCTLIITGGEAATATDIIRNTTNSIQYDLENGDYNWSVNCTDRAGNMNDSAFRNFTVNTPPSMPKRFVDTTDLDFGQGSLYRANVTGSGNNANVTLNYTIPPVPNINATWPVYNLTGNITSRIFDTGDDSTNLSAIAWVSALPNSSDVMGIAMDDTSNNVAAFYRNGSFGVDLLQTNLGSGVNFTDALNRYTIPAGWSYDDIICAAVDGDASNLAYLLFRNASVLSAASTFTADMAFTMAAAAAGENSIPQGFNFSNVVGCAIDTGAGDTALFFNNGTMISNTGDENPPVKFTTSFTYSLVSGFQHKNILGVTVDNTANNIMAFFIDGRSNNGTTANFNGNKVITAGINETNYNNLIRDFVNVTESTNVTLQTRVSNSSTAISSKGWSPFYMSNEGSTLADTIGRYVQYKAILTTRDKYMTPYLENVTVNYTESNPPRINLVFPTPANNTYTRYNYFYVNASITDAHTTDKCILDFDNANQSMFITRDGRNATCSLNNTNLDEGAYYYKVWANDTFGNMNSSEERNITIDLTAPDITLVSVYPSEIFNLDNVSILLTITDANQINWTFIEGNWSNRFTNSSPINSSGDNYNFTIFSKNLSSSKLVAFRFYANDTAGNLRITQWYNFTVINSVGNVSITNPLFDTSRYVNETLFVNATLTAVNGSVNNCRMNISNQTGLVAITPVNISVGNFSNGSTSVSVGWVLNGTVEGTYRINITSNCSEGLSTIAYSPFIEITPTLSNLSEEHYSERKKVNGVNYFHMSAETGANWWINNTEEMISFNSTAPGNYWFKNRWLIIVNGTSEFDFSNITWDMQRTGADNVSNYTFIQFIGRMLNSTLQVNYTKIAYSNSKYDNITFSIRNIGSNNVSNVKLKWIFSEFNVSNDYDSDVLRIVNSSSETETHVMDSTASLRYNQSRFGNSVAYFTDSDTDTKGIVYWEFNIGVDGVKQVISNFTFETGGDTFTSNLTFSLGNITSGQVKGLDPGAGLATPSRIQRTATISNMEASEAGTTYTDVTAPLTDNNFATQNFMEARAGNNVRVLNIVNNTDPSSFDQIFIRVRMDSMGQTPYYTAVYAYNNDNITINTALNANKTFKNTDVNTWVNVNITNVAHLQDGFGHLRVRFTPNGSSVGTNLRITFDELAFNLTDMTPPVPILASPVNDFNTTSNELMFNFTVTDRVDMNITCNFTIDRLINLTNLNISNGTYVNFTFVNLSGGVHKWNVTCWDDYENINASQTRNFTIVEAVFALNATLAGDNESILLDWNDVGYADRYNIYMIDNYNEPFSATPNFTISTDSNYTDTNAANKTTRFYRVSVVKGNINATSNRTVGKFEFELVNNSNALSDWNLISLPLNITNFILFNGSNNGTDLKVKPLGCIKSLWFLNTTAGPTGKFMRTNYNGSAWFPASGSENFTSLATGRGYWAEVNISCNLTIVGEVPTGNSTFDLYTGWGVVGWYSPNASKLPRNFASPYPIVISPANSVKAMYRYNATSDKFEITSHFIIGGNDWGWNPSSNNRNFVGMDPTSGYYLDVTAASAWKHKPNYEKS